MDVYNIFTFCAIVYIYIIRNRLIVVVVVMRKRRRSVVFLFQYIPDMSAIPTSAERDVIYIYIKYNLIKIKKKNVK